MLSNNRQNPLLQASSLEYLAPEFDLIMDSDFEPAFLFGIEKQNEAIARIINNANSPNFENTIVSIEKSGEDLKRVLLIFDNLNSANTNPTLQALDLKYSPIFTQQTDAIFLNSELFKKVERVYQERVKNNISGEDLRLLTYYYDKFMMAGANLSESQKLELKAINSEIAILSTTFSNKLLAATKNGSLLLNQLEELAGLNNEDLEIALEMATNAGFSGKYLLPLSNTTQQPALQNLNLRKTREKLFEHSINRAKNNDQNDTRETILQLVKLKSKKAKLLGKNNFAEWQLQDQMAQTPEAAFELLSQLGMAATKKAEKEKNELENLAQSLDQITEFKAYDWNFYAEKLRKKAFDLDENEIKAYFEIHAVVEKGAFFAAEELYGISFKKTTEFPVYHEDVVVYEVIDVNHESLGLFYLDYYSRENKQGGAWMNNYVEQTHLNQQKPVISNVFNFQKPTKDNPCLISLDDVITVFHELGHALHGFFANQKYESLSGTNVPRDFVEFPSQINEYWALHPKVLKNYAKHYQTKKSIPEELIAKIQKALQFNEGYFTTELVAAATLDMAWHTVTETEAISDVSTFENEAMRKYKLNLDTVPPRYHSTYFSHIFGGGYSAGYYAYIWADVLNYDAINWFERNGGLNRTNGDLFRKHVLSIGNTTDLNEAYLQLTGKKPSIEALLQGKGLK